MARTIKELVAVISAKVSGYVEPMKQVLKVTGEVGSSFKRFADDAASMATRTSAAIAGAASSALYIAGAFEDQMQQIRNMLTAVPTDKVQALGNGIRQMSVQFGRDTSVISEGIFEILSSGGELNTVLKDLSGLMPLVVAGQASLGDSTKLVGNIVNSYKLSWQQTAMVTDKIFKTNELGVTSIQALAGSVANMTDLAYTAGISLDEMFGALASATVSAPSTSEAVTRLASAMRTLLAGNDDLNAVFQKYGFVTSEAAVRTLGLTRAAKILTDETKGETGALIAMTGRAETAMGILSIAGDNFERTSRFIDEMKNSTGLADAAMKSAQQNGIEAFRQGGQYLKDIWREIGLKIMPDAVDAFRSLVSTLGASKSEIVDGAVTFYRQLIDQGELLIAKFREAVPAILEFAKTVGGVIVEVARFAAEHPKLVAFFALFSAANMLGITTSIGSLGSALVSAGGALKSFFLINSATGVSGFGSLISGATKFAGFLRGIPKLVMIDIIPSFIAWGMTITKTNTLMGMLSTGMKMMAVGGAAAIGVIAAAFLVLLPLAIQYRQELEEMRESGEKLEGQYNKLAREDSKRQAEALAEQDIATVRKRLEEEKKILEVRKQQAEASAKSLKDYETVPKASGLVDAAGNAIAGAGQYVTDAVGFTDSGAPARQQKQINEAAQRALEAAQEGVLDLQKHLERLTKNQADGAALHARLFGEMAAPALEEGAANAGGILGEKAAAGIGKGGEKAAKALMDAMEGVEKRKLEREQEGASEVNEFLKNNPTIEQLEAFLMTMDLDGAQVQGLIQAYKDAIAQAIKNGEKIISESSRQAIAIAAARMDAAEKARKERQDKKMDNEAKGASGIYKETKDLDFGSWAQGLFFADEAFKEFFQSLDGMTEEHIERIRSYIKGLAEDGVFDEEDRRKAAIKIAKEAEQAEKEKREKEEKKKANDDASKEGFEQAKDISFKGMEAVGNGTLTQEALDGMNKTLDGLEKKWREGSISGIEYQKAVQRVGDAMAQTIQYEEGLRKAVANGFNPAVANAFAAEQRRLTKLYGENKLSAEQYAKAMQGLKTKTDEAVAAQQRAALLAGNWKGAGLDMRKAVEDRIADRRMQQFNEAAERMANQMMGISENVSDASKQFGEAFQGGFLGAMMGGGGGGGNQEGQWSALWANLFSENGQIANLNNNIAMMSQVYQVMMTVDAKQAELLLAQINAMSDELTKLLSKPSYFTEANGPAFIKDPGLKDEKSGRGGDVTIKLDVPPGYGPGDVGRLVDDIGTEMARRGSSFFN